MLFPSLNLNTQVVAGHCRQHVACGLGQRVGGARGEGGSGRVLVSAAPHAHLVLLQKSWESYSASENQKCLEYVLATTTLELLRHNNKSLLLGAYSCRNFELEEFTID